MPAPARFTSFVRRIATTLDPRRPIVQVPVWIATIGLVASPAFAGDWYVDVNASNCASGTGGPSDPFCKIMDAVNVALDGDTIHVAAGTYPENLLIDKDLVLIGTDGEAVTIVDGGAADSVAKITAGRTVQIEGLTLTNGNAELGGGIHNEGNLIIATSTICGNLASPGFNDPALGGGIYNEGILTLADSKVDGNSATTGFGNPNAGMGGGIFNSGTLTITNSSVSSNLADDDGAYDSDSAGGGILSYGPLILIDTTVSGNSGQYGGGILAGGSLSLTRSTVSGNSAGYGGGIDCGGDSVTVTDSVVIDNVAGQGGGIANGGSLTLIGSIVRGNSASDFGGGILSHGTLILIHSTVTGNSGSDFGGGILASGDTTLINSMVSANTALGFSGPGGIGGGICLGVTGDLHLIDSTVIENSANGGGGIGVSDFFSPWTGKAALDHATIAGNVATSFGGGAALACDSTHSVIAGNTAPTDPDCSGVLTSQGHNCIGDTTGCTITGDPTGNLLDVDPQFIDPSTGDFSLGLHSPCVDAGDLALRPSGRDVAGNPRFLDGNLDRRMVVDIGAYEFCNVHLAITGSATPAATLTFQTTGTPLLLTFLFVGTALGEIQFKPYGSAFIDLAQPWSFFPFAVIPDSTDIDVPTSLPPGTSFVLQELAVDIFSFNGNFSNAVDLVIE